MKPRPVEITTTVSSVDHEIHDKVFATWLGWGVSWVHPEAVDMIDNDLAQPYFGVPHETMGIIEFPNGAVELLPVDEFKFLHPRRSQKYVPEGIRLGKWAGKPARTKRE